MRLLLSYNEKDGNEQDGNDHDGTDQNGKDQKWQAPNMAKQAKFVQK